MCDFVFSMLNLAKKNICNPSVRHYKTNYVIGFLGMYIYFHRDDSWQYCLIAAWPLIPGRVKATGCRTWMLITCLYSYVRTSTCTCV